MRAPRSPVRPEHHSGHANVVARRVAAIDNMSLTNRPTVPNGANQPVIEFVWTLKHQRKQQKPIAWIGVSGCQLVAIADNLRDVLRCVVASAAARFIRRSAGIFTIPNGYPALPDRLGFENDKQIVSMRVVSVAEDNVRACPFHKIGYLTFGIRIELAEPSSDRVFDLVVGMPPKLRRAHQASAVAIAIALGTFM